MSTPTPQQAKQQDPINDAARARLFEAFDRLRLGQVDSTG